MRAPLLLVPLISMVGASLAGCAAEERDPYRFPEYDSGTTTQIADSRVPEAAVPADGSLLDVPPEVIPREADAVPEAGAGDVDVSDASPDRVVPDAEVDGSGPRPDGGRPTIVSLGVKTRIVLQGVVVTPDRYFDGEVLIDGSSIVCAAPSCSAHASYAGSTVVQTQGMIYPGLIDAHNHVLYNVFDETDWTPKKRYDNHTQWTAEPEYDAMQSAYDFLLDSTSAGGKNLDCEVLKYGEIKGLLGGTTSMVGAPKGSAQTCFGSLARSIDGQYNDLPSASRTGPCLDAPPEAFSQDGPSSDHIQVASLGIDSVDSTAARENFRNCKTWSYVVHVAEGVPTNASAYGEWTKVKSMSLDVPQMTIVHGTALSAGDFQHMADRGMKLVWSPRSNMALYGQTTRIDQAIQTTPRLTIALAPDWSMGGSVNLLDELNFARDLDRTQWGGVLSAKDLVLMVTRDAAKALEVQDFLGTIEVGKLADLLVVSGDSRDPYGALVGARPSDVSMVFVGGNLLYGDASLVSVSASPSCEMLDVCQASRFLCVAESTTQSKLGQTFSEIRSTLEAALTEYDGAHGTKFSPLAPVAKCP